MTQLFDVSLPISPAMMTWPGDPGVELHRAKSLQTDGANVSNLKIGTHTGTHVDPASHFIDGAGGIDTIPVDVLVGPCVVVDARDAEVIDEAVVARAPQDAERVLFRTRNSEIWARGQTEFPSSYVYVTIEGARALVGRGVRLVGVDFLSVEKQGAPGHPVHVALLEQRIVIVEGLNLSQIEPGEYTLACLPLKIADGDGAPARAVLMR